LKLPLSPASVPRDVSDERRLSGDATEDSRNDKAILMRHACNNTPGASSILAFLIWHLHIFDPDNYEAPDAERSESPGGAYLYPGSSGRSPQNQARRSPATSSRLASHQSSLDGGDATRLPPGYRSQGSLSAVDENSRSETLPAHQNENNGFERKGEDGRDGIRRMLLSLLMCAQQVLIVIAHSCSVAMRIL
jgi:hypothetical protein